MLRRHFALAMIFSFFVIPFNVCYVMLVLCILMIGYIVGLAFYTRLVRYSLIALFAIGSTAFYYITDTLLRTSWTTISASVSRCCWA